MTVKCGGRVSGLFCFYLFKGGFSFRIEYDDSFSRTVRLDSTGTRGAVTTWR